jgi:hypothetical protein
VAKIVSLNLNANNVIEIRGLDTGY